MVGVCPLEFPPVPPVSPSLARTEEVAEGVLGSISSLVQETNAIADNKKHERITILFIRFDLKIRHRKGGSIMKSKILDKECFLKSPLDYYYWEVKCIKQLIQNLYFPDKPNPLFSYTFF